MRENERKCEEWLKTKADENCKLSAHHVLPCLPFPPFTWFSTLKCCVALRICGPLNLHVHYIAAAIVLSFSHLLAMQVAAVIVATGKHSQKPHLVEHHPLAEVVHASKLDSVNMKNKRILLERELRLCINGLALDHFHCFFAPDM